ncbi:MAG: hypothetical protein WA082_01335 [Candidatus Moraniibacteriota bacterium]
MKLNFENAESGPKQLLFIEPNMEAAPRPVLDEITRKMAASFAHAEEYGPRSRGFHICKCGAQSTNTDYKLPNDMVTNSLAVHYVAMHREEVPQEMLDEITRFNDGETEPTEEMLQTKVFDRPYQDNYR